MEKGYLKTTDGAYIYYEDYGCGEDCILFVPGHMCTTKFFAKNIAELSKKHRVVAIDNRGFGNSSKPLQGNSIERNADDIKEIIDHLKLNNVLLMGWSLSGSIVTTYAHKYDDYNLKALGLLDCCLFPFSPDSWNAYNSRNYNMDDWNKKYRLWYTEPEIYLDNFMSRVKPNLTAEEAVMVREELKKTPPWIGFALHTDWCHTDATKYLAKLKVPVIIFSGESKGHSATMGAYYKTQIQTYCEHHVYEKGGHVLFMAEAASFNAFVENFLTRITLHKI